MGLGAAVWIRSYSYSARVKNWNTCPYTFTVAGMGTRKTRGASYLITKNGLSVGERRTDARMHVHGLRRAARTRRLWGGWRDRRGGAKFSLTSYHTTRQEFAYNKTDKTLTRSGTAKTQKTRAPSKAPSPSKFDKRRRMPVMKNKRARRRYMVADPSGMSVDG